MQASLVPSKFGAGAHPGKGVALRMPGRPLFRRPSRLSCASLLLALLVAFGLPVLAQPATQGPLDAHLHRLLDDAFEELLLRRPTELTRLGRKTLQDRWDDLDPAEHRARVALWQDWAARVRREVPPSELGTEAALSQRLFLAQADQEKEALEFQDYDYPLNQMTGYQTGIPAFLLSMHRIDSPDDAEAYLLRLERVPALVDQLIEGLARRERRGIVAPSFILDTVLEDLDRLSVGYPLTEDPSSAHPIWEDFCKKLAVHSSWPSETRASLEARLRKALEESFAPAYRELRQVVAEQRQRADERAGCWKFPEGERFYAFELRRQTTTSRSAEEIHQLGLAEVARLQAEMREVLHELQFEGSLEDFFALLRQDERFTYPNTEAGRQAYLDQASATIRAFEAQLDRLFLRRPRAPLEVRRVESFREKSVGKAFYEPPALDGSRPGVYYANLYDMTSMPIYQLEALAYHEGIPGHHMQLAIAQELDDLPKFRRLADSMAYIEGWGLYCELLPREHGFYRDPYSNFGRLAMELFRAVRLVVDTGIHHHRWTRQQALDYYLNNTPNAPGECQKMVDRHIVLPGQATTYKIGMIEILRLRQMAQDTLGEAFDLRRFHDVVLRHGAVPLEVLEELVQADVAAVQAGLKRP